LVMREEKT